MHNMYRGGTPDVWYSGKGGDLWVEYKWSTAKKGVLVPDLSALQMDWLTKRLQEGRNVAVVVGSTRGAAILIAPSAWVHGSNPTALESDVARWIEMACA